MFRLNPATAVLKPVLYIGFSASAFGGSYFDGNEEKNYARSFYIESAKITASGRRTEPHLAYNIYEKKELNSTATYQAHLAPKLFYVRQAR